ncbi:MAG: hypothetical protein Kow00124_07320 [Anaerolineae bacterium]
MPSSYVVMRSAEIDLLLGALSRASCVSVVGLSNMGKSTLLRSLCSPETAARYTETVGRRVDFIYVDCNGILELTGQGFYEVVLRSLREQIADCGPDLMQKIEACYAQVVEPESSFLVPLSFNKAMTAIIEQEDRDLVLLLDEFDEVFDALDGRVFLNLRALKDKYTHSLSYVTATVRRLGARRADDAATEFVELSAPRTVILGPFRRSEADEFASAVIEEAGLPPLSGDELDFLWLHTGGHPRLLRAMLSHLLELRLYHPQRYQQQGLSWLLHEMAHDVMVRAECAHLWSQLGPEERDALTAVAVTGLEGISPPVLQSLKEWGMLAERDGRTVVFAEIMADYVRRQAAVSHRVPDGIWIDTDSGDVWVEGVLTSSLTELEFKLLSLLYERANKLTDKYQIVETVWGVDYISSVDDARIEKLISRLRSKIEPEPGAPRFIITVRGRGYKLVT